MRLERGVTANGQCLTTMTGTNSTRVALSNMPAEAISCIALNGDGVSAIDSNRWEARKPGTVCKLAMLRM